MSVLVVGSVALDTVETPFGKAEEALGGSAVYFSAAASLFGPVSLVGVVGEDYPVEALDFLRDRNVDLSGLEKAPGESFRWSGVYSFDLNARETKETRLGVFADFQPVLGAEAREARFVFLGNIHPQLQLDVLDQVKDPALVACDTMNLWIDTTRDTLLDLLEKVDILLLNDAEARQLSGDPNLYRAAHWILERGPSLVVVKKGEYGATLYADEWLFFIPGYPLEEVYDPTGAGDAFAGGFIGHLASVHPERTRQELQRAVVFGSATASFAVEDFSVDRLARLRHAEVLARVLEFREMTAFEHGVGDEEVERALAGEGTGVG